MRLRNGMLVMKTPSFLHATSLAIVGVVFVGLSMPALATLDPVVVGVDGDEPWESAGDIRAYVILNPTTVDQTNAPGGVLNFEHPGRPGWIFPKQADESLNIVVGIDDPGRGGSVKTLPSFFDIVDLFEFMWDDDGNTAMRLEPERPTRGLLIDFDLGAVFNVNRIRFFPRNAAEDFRAPRFPFQKDFIKGYEVSVNDGSPQSVLDEQLIWDSVGVDGENEIAVVDLPFPTRQVRYIRLKSLQPVGFEIAEFQVFGEGFVPEASYISDVFDFRQNAILGNLRWIEEQIRDPTRSQVLIRTRTGIDRDPVEYSRIGLQPSGRVKRLANSLAPIPIDALWKESGDVSDSRLKALIDTLLDAEFDGAGRKRDGREVLLEFQSLPQEDRDAITLGREGYLATENPSVIRDDLRNWSPWSAPYPAHGRVTLDQIEDPTAGTPITSPSPRRYFQFQIAFASNSFSATRGIGALAVDVVRPAFADSLIAEILPRAAEVGREIDFTYAVLAKGPNINFDRFEIQTPLRTESIGLIEIVEPGGTVRSADFSGQPLTDLPVERDGFTVIDTRHDGFTIEFAPPIAQDSTLLKLEFQSSVLRVGTRFGGKAINTADPLFGQAAAAGNAADLSQAELRDPDTEPVGTLMPGNLFVAVPVAGRLLINVGAAPAVFTPDGDGTNDAVTIRFDLTNIAQPANVEIQIFDLSGRLIWSDTQAHVSGRFGRLWDGRDRIGHLVPPGNYLYSVSLTAGTGKERRTGVVGVAY